MHTKQLRRGNRTVMFALASWLVIGAMAGCIAYAQQAFDTQKEVVLPGSQLEFQNLNPMIKMASAWGDKSKDAHGTFGKFPPDFITPFHTHTGAYHGVVIKGVMTNPFKGETNPPHMEPGSYWYVPANAIHATACVSDIPCEFYFHAKEAFDFHEAK